MPDLRDNRRLRRILARIYPFMPQRIAGNLAQWWLRLASEADFELLGRMSAVEALVVDIGANRGHSAISVLSKTRRMKVFSLEPNQALRWALFTIKLLHPVRFRFRMVGAGTERSTRVLHIPLSRGYDLSPQASLNVGEFDKWWVRERLRESGHDMDGPHPFKRRAVHVVPLDSLNLAPDLIKIDTEGSECEVLEGAEQTLRTHLPTILIEVNEAESWLPKLRAMGYRFYRYDPARHCMQICDPPEGILNLWCLNPGQKGVFADSLRALLEPGIQEQPESGVPV